MSRQLITQLIDDLQRDRGAVRAGCQQRNSIAFARGTRALQGFARKPGNDGPDAPALLLGHCPRRGKNIVVNRECCTHAAHRNLHLASRIKLVRSHPGFNWPGKRRPVSVLLCDACRQPGRRVAPVVPCRRSKYWRLSSQWRSYPPTDGAIPAMASRANELSVQVRRLRPASLSRSRSSPSKGRAQRESVPVRIEVALGDPRPTASTDWPRREAGRQFAG